MKMPSTMSVMLDQKVNVPAPLKPIKGEYPWGVGKAYRRCRREYAKQMRQFKKGPKTIHRRIYVPFAQVELVMARNEEDAEVRQVAKPVTAEFTFQVTPESRGLFYGN